VNPFDRGPVVVPGSILLEPIELRGARNSVDPASEIMTANEVAAFLKVNRATVYRLVRRKELPSVRVGWDHRFRRADIDEWIRKNQQGR
jgi:excisionase family DNA binding protein